jgi:iron complex outermembrane receptor protein
VDLPAGKRSPVSEHSRWVTNIIDALGTLGSAADERSANARVDVPVGGNFVLHADGSTFKSDDLRTGGYILSPELRAEARASSDAEIRDLADLRGDLPNSAAKSSEIAGGVAYIDGRLNVGASIARFDNLYGAPVRYSLEPGGEAEQVRLDQRQTRYDVRAEIPVGGFIDQVKIRGGAVRYRHDELEESGEIGTTFRSRGEEGRIEAVQRTRGGWGGGFGVQYLDRRVSVVGEEKYLPPNQQRQIGLFTLQNYETGPVPRRSRRPDRAQPPYGRCGRRPRQPGAEAQLHQPGGVDRRQRRRGASDPRRS